ncbi:MAG: prephenate dehydratase [Candidatus Nanohaloarchaea archaeon]
MGKKVAFLGPRGTYTHQAVEDYFEDYEAVPCSSLQDIFDADADAAVIPFENSLGGGVGKSVDLLREKDAEVTGEVKVRIDHVLLSREEDIEDIEKVRSHPQALSQCRDFLSGHDWEEVESSSTAKAAEEVGKGEAAIASRLAGELNDLNVLAEDIQDRETNTTRFLVLNGESREGDKTALVLEPGEDRPGLLHSMLSCFSGHGINLSYIQSRPTRDGLGEYYFFVEAEVDRRDDSFRKARRCLETYADVNVLGSYTNGDTA